jgi:hypothetical protein
MFMDSQEYWMLLLISGVDPTTSAQTMSSAGAGILAKVRPVALFRVGSLNASCCRAYVLRRFSMESQEAAYLRIAANRALSTALGT